LVFTPASGRRQSGFTPTHVDPQETYPRLGARLWKLLSEGRFPVDDRRPAGGNVALREDCPGGKV
jgi:hypothetical protein